MDEKQNSNFITLFRNRIHEAGIILKEEVLNLMNNSGILFSSLVGNELVIATFAPMIPELIFDEVKRRIFADDIHDLAKKLENNKDILNENFIRSDFGRKLFQDVIKEILNESEKDKREYLKRFLVSAYVEQNPRVVHTNL